MILLITRKTAKGESYETPPCLDLVVETECGKSHQRRPQDFFCNPLETLGTVQNRFASGRELLGVDLQEEQEDPRPLQHCSCELSWK